MDNFVRKIIFLAVFLFSTALSSQELIKGQVVDRKTNEGIAFVSLTFNAGQNGVAADINGYFEFKTNPGLSKITISGIGYQTVVFSVEELQKTQKIKLQRSFYALQEVEILAGENPAHRLIQKAIENREINNPELATEFYYESYNKLIFTSPLDSNSKSKLDSITFNNAVNLNNTIDSIPIHKVAFIMESVADRNHVPPDFTKEVIKQSRISGLKTPFFSLLGTQLQSFSLYKDFITIYGINYLSPVSKGSIDKYLFVLEDTLFTGQDTSFIISFRPRRNKYFQGLNGALSINSNQYAVENFSAQQHDSTSFPVKIQQRYEFIDNTQWFPTQLHIDIVFETSMKSGFTIIGKGSSYMRNIELKSRIERKEIKNLVITTDPDIETKDEEFWQSVREVPLTENEKLTYQFVDSIGEKENLDRLVFLTRGLLRGYIPVGKFNLTLNKILKFNQYENVRLGLGLETGEDIIKKIRIGGFAGYGVKDEVWKYGSHVRWVSENERQFEAKLAYFNDIVGIGGTTFNNQISSFTATSNIQNFINDQYDGVEKYEVSTSFRALRDVHFTLFGNQQKRSFNLEYTFLNEGGEIANIDHYHLTETGIDLRFSYKEKFGEMLGVILPVETKYPVFYLKYTKGFNNQLNGQFDYNRLDFSFYKTSVLKGLGRMSLQINAGFIDEVLPLTTLFGMRGIFDPNINVASSFSFETMFPNEFYADQYVNLFFRHNFGSLLFKSPKFKPQLLLVSSYAIGTLTSPVRHQNFDFKTLEQGFSESGIQFNNLVRIKYLYEGIYFGFGVGAYYRYGAYANPDFEDNVALKLTTTLGI